MRIACFLPNWIGDVVMATPALHALWEAYPQGEMFAVGRPYVRGTVEGAPWFDAFVEADAKGWWQTARRLRALHCDAAVLFPNSFRSAATAWLARIPRRVGYSRSGRSWLLTDGLPPKLDERGQFAISPVLDAYNLLAERLDGQPTQQMRLYTTAADEAAADAVWRRLGLFRRSEVVALNPGAAFGAAKFWPVEHFVALARDLVDRRGAGVLVLCGPAERDLARMIAGRTSRPSVVALADEDLSLGLTKACVKRAALLVTTDSGPRHFAAAFGRPVVSLFGPTHIGWTETYHAQEICLQKRVPCGPCQQRTCHLDHACMTTLSPNEVFAAVEQLLGAREARHAG